MKATAISLRLMPSLREVSAAPVGAALAGRSFLTWCATPRLSGTVHFGRRDLGDASVLASLYGLASHPSLRPPLRRVVDGRAFEGVDEDAWAHMAEVMSQQTSALHGRFERQAVVVTGGVSGARTAALLPALGPGDAFRLFTNALEAYVWADPEHGRDAHAAVESLLETLGANALLARVRAWIAAHLREADLPACARALGVSSRTLQRRMAATGRSFRELVALERVEAARALLTQSRASVKSVAYAVGCSSSSQLGVLLHRAGLPSTSKLRATSSSEGE